eukprot:TRINITY_DN1479_c0_g7_i1.p1 TRINITY_DN1479_c0_g7~~TRINITY_DN1479_c0_g7_i1.p1  ORF type:complete len:823 (-),score=191.24 TRINITY_DN1479_c0_g7_i1:900-3368(-)
MTYCSYMTPRATRDRDADTAEATEPANMTAVDAPSAQLVDPSSMPLRVGISRISMPLSGIPGGGNESVDALLVQADGGAIMSTCLMKPQSLDASVAVVDFASCSTDRRVPMSPLRYEPFYSDVNGYYVNDSSGMRPVGKLSVILRTRSGASVRAGTFELEKTMWVAGRSGGGSGELAIGSSFTSENGLRALVSLSFNCSLSGEASAMCHAPVGSAVKCKAADLGAFTSRMLQFEAQTCDQEYSVGSACDTTRWTCATGYQASGALNCLPGGFWATSGVSCIAVGAAECRQASNSCEGTTPVCDAAECIDTKFQSGSYACNRSMKSKMCLPAPADGLIVKATLIGGNGIPVRRSGNTQASVLVEYQEGGLDRVQMLRTPMPSTSTCPVSSGANPSWYEQCPDRQRFSQSPVKLPATVSAAAVRFAVTVSDTTMPIDPVVLARYTASVEDAVSLSDGMVEMEASSPDVSGAVLLRLELDSASLERCQSTTTKPPALCIPFLVSKSPSDAVGLSRPCETKYLRVPHLDASGCGDVMAPGQVCMSSAFLMGGSGLPGGSSPVERSVMCDAGYKLVGSDLRCGWNGDFVAVPTCVDVDECAPGMDVCDPNGLCTNTDGGYECRCGPGFRDMSPTGSRGEYGDCAPLPSSTVSIKACKEKGEICADETEGGLCVLADLNDLNSAKCMCVAGYVGDGKTCTKAAVPFKPLPRGVTPSVVERVTPALASAGFVSLSAASPAVPSPPSSPPSESGSDGAKGAVIALGLICAVGWVALVVVVVVYVVLPKVRGPTRPDTAVFDSYARPLAMSPVPDAMASYAEDTGRKAVPA